jgi:DNA-binding CsgD family transcriptional regulator
LIKQNHIILLLIHYAWDSNKIEDIIYSNIGFLKIYIKKDDPFKINSLFSEIDKLFESEKNKYSPEQLSESYLLRNYAYAYGLMGDYYRSKKNYTSAIDYFKQAKILLKKFPVEIPRLDVYIAECYLAQNQWEKAKISAENNLKKIKGPFFRVEKKRNFEVLEKVYISTADNSNLIRVKDSLIKMASFGAVLNLGNKFNELESNILLAKKRAELNDSKIMYNIYLFILIIGSTILLFSLISLRLNFNLQKEKSDKISAEKKYFESALEHKKMELITKSNYIAQRNKNLNYILESVEKIDDTKKDYRTTIMKEKISLLLKSDNINNRFEKQFEEVYPNFFKNLIEKSERLSQNDLRLCAYLKMNQNTHEIAQLSGVSIRTIESQKYRLKKKLNLSKEENLIQFLIKI